MACSQEGLGSKIWETSVSLLIDGYCFFLVNIKSKKAEDAEEISTCTETWSWFSEIIAPYLQVFLDVKGPPENASLEMYLFIYSLQ